jgi:two-component system, OmpR family, response regulator
MSGATTILVAREDFSIPGAPDAPPVGNGAAGHEAHFFELLRASNPDAIVLDFSRGAGTGVETILKIRQQSTIPIVVVCNSEDPAAREYRIAGAVECILAPVDLLVLNQTLQQIKKVTRLTQPQTMRIADAVAFAGLVFHPYQNLLTDVGGASTRLTSSESRLLSLFVSRPWALHTRAEVGEMLYGRHRPTSDRAIDVVVNRLRKKLVSLCGPNGQSLIKTEFRRGYMLVSDVSPATPPAAAGGRLGLAAAAAG